MSSSLPLIAIVGRPNVGKSTLFNRLIGQRRSIVTDEPGITRDRIYGTLHWHGRTYEVVDTGGLIPGEHSEIPVRIFEQARIAMETAALIFFVVDGRSGITPPDQELIRLLRRTGKPVFLVVNKIDSEKQASEASEFYRLGVDHVFPISAEHGRGITELLDELAISVPAPERNDVAILIIDATAGVTALDAHIAGYAHQAGRSIIIAVNKWDLIQKTHRVTADFETDIREKLKFISFSPIVSISAKTGQRVQKLYGAIDEVHKARFVRIQTSDLNEFLRQEVLARGGLPLDVKIRYIAQVKVDPPTFVLFSNKVRKLHFSFERFMENRIRERFPFPGTPIIIKQRAKSVAHQTGD